MSGRPQGRGRQVRRDRSQPKRVRDHSADSVGSSTSTQSERDREHRNGRNSRRRPEKNNDRGRRRNDENRRDVSERDNVKGNAVENKEKPKQRSESEKQPPRGREANRDASRDLNPECSVSKAATNDRNNMFGDDSRLSHIIKRITKESDRDRRLTAAQQLEEFLNSPDNYQMIDKYAENLFTVLEDVLFERGLPELKEKVANCIGLIGGNLGNEAGRFFQWIFSKLESSITDEVKIPLLLSLGKAIQVDTKNKYFRDFMTSVMSSVQNILENVDTSDLLRAALNVMMPIATEYPHAFAGHFRDTVDILVGWHIDTSQQNSLTSYTSECLVKLHDYWVSDLAFSLTLLSQFLEDMEAYAEELGMLSNQVVTSDEIPSPYISLPRLTALVRVFTTVVNGIGPSFSPNRSPSITPPYLTELIQRIIHCINMSGYSYYYEKLFVSANQCLESMCSWLQPYFSCCCEITASFVIQQLNSTSCVTYTHIMSALQLVQKVVTHVNTAIPQSFIQQLLEPGSPVMKLRTSSDEAVLSSVMKIYQGFLGIHDVPLLDTAYKIAVTELTSSFNTLKKMLQVNVNSDSQFETLSDINNCKAASSDGEGVGDGTTDPDKSASETSLASFRSSYELETIIIFDLCALSEIATSKSAILRLWKLSPSPFQLLTQHLDACEWTIAVCHPSIQYTILHALYTYCQRYNHFLPNSQSEGIRVSPDGDMVSMFSLLSNVLRNSSTSQDSRKLCLVWLFEILDKAVTTGVLPLVSKNISLDSIALSILPSTFDHDPSMSVEISLCLKILIEMKVLSKKCLKKFYKDCSIRLMDVDKDVRRSYQELIKALPTDLLTSSLNQILFESRITKESGTVAVGNPLTTSCNDVWLARKGHAIKPPIGSFHSHDFQMVMGFILSGNFPSKEINVDWLTRLFHSCNRVQRYSETEMVQFDRCESLLWFWATWEVAQFCILSRLRTPLGRAQETFQAIEGALQKFIKDINREGEESKPKLEERSSLEEEEEDQEVSGSKPYLNHLQCVLLLQFIENLEKLMYNGYEGCVVGLPSPPKSVRVFFRTNRGTCLEWLARVRKPVMSVGSACGSPATTVWHGFQTLQEMKKGENTQGEEFDTAVLQTALALSELKSAHAISGLKAWCEQVTGRKFSWTNGIVMKAKGWYESSAAEYKSTLEEAFKMEAKKSHQEEQKAKDSSSPSNAVTAFLVNETTDCYMKLSSWNEVLEWQKHLANLRKQCSDNDAQHSLMPNVDMNYVKALSKFEDCNFTSIHDHLRLIPGAALNSLTENLTKSAWSVKLNHPDATFTPVWAPDKIEQTAMLSLIQAETLFFTSGTRTKTKDNNTKEQKIIQAVKACIHHSASLCESVLRVGAFSWPVDVSASHIAQLQFAAAVKNILDTEGQQDEVSPSFLQGNGTFTVDHTQHDTAVLNKALRFCSNLHHVVSSVGKHQNSLRSELVSLQLATAELARKHHNFNLAQRLLLKQVSLLVNPVKISQDLNCNKKQFLESLMQSLNDDVSVASAKPVDVMRIQRECSKLAFALGYNPEAVYFLSDSISQYSNLGDIDSNVGELNSRSLLTLAKWLLNDRKLLTAVTKVNGNGLSVAMKISSLCELEASYVALGHSTLIPPQDDVAESSLNANNIPSVSSGVTDAESVCGQLLHLATMQSPDLGKAWLSLAGWCYRWGRKTVEQASSMGNVDLLPKEKETVLQNLPQAAKPAEVESVLLVLGQVHVAAYFNQEEDIGEEDQVYDDGVESTKKQLLTVCPGLQDAQPQLLDKLLSVWTGVRDRLFKHYHFAAKAYFMYLRMGAENCDKSSAFNNEPVTCQTSKSSDDDSNVTATLRLLRLVVKHAGELRSELEEGLVTTPTRPWKDITPQLFSRLNHPENYVRQSVSELLCRIGQDAPHLIVYPAVVGCSTSLPKYLLNKGKEGEGLLPLLVSHSSNTSSEDTLMQGSQSSETPNKPESDALASCYQIIVDSIRVHNPRLVSELQEFTMELRRITLLWEELWHGSLMQTHHDVSRRQQQLEEEIKRVHGNQNLTNQQKATLIKEKHIAIMKPVVFAMEQLSKITSQEPATPHEQWFQMSYGEAIKGAIEALQNPPDPTDHRSSWEPFKQLLQALQVRSQRRSAYVLRMDEISPALHRLKGSAVYMPGQTHFSGKIVTIDSVITEVNILPTKTKPKKLVFVGSDGQRYTYLFKGLEDLHLDERIMQFLSICNNMFARVDSHSSPLFCARHYSVTPLGPRSGLIQWVDGAVPVFALFKRWQQREVSAMALVKSAQGTNQPPPQPMKPSELYYSKITPALKEKGITDMNNRRDWPLSVLRQALEDLMKETPSDLLAKELWCSSTSAAEWWQMTQSYARSTAVMSMIGYIIGLGDRHLDNMLVDFTTGEVVHIDYNVCFEKGKGLRVPEKVPFRMTPNLEMALGVTGVEGVFRLSCEEVLKILKQGRETLLTLLEAFVYDPLVDWTTANDTAFASAFYGGGATGVTDNKMNKKEMERGVTQSLFSSRVAEMKVTWTNNKDELLLGMNKLDEKLDAFLGSLKQLKSLDLSNEELKDQQETLQAAIGNSQHILHSVQAKFDEKKKLLADHDTVLQTITEKLNECQQWQAQHQAAMETVHGQKLASLLGELLQPFDLGLPSFAPAISFLKGAGQGHIVTQCEQLETELSGLLNQRRTMFRSCLDLLHTYATVTSRFPADYVKQNRSFQWQSWLQSLLEDSSTKNCQVVLAASEKMHSKPATDNPVSLVVVTGFIAMEVKLQSSLTEQNSKFIKFSERRKQESVETTFLSKAVSDAYAALKKHISGKQPTSFRCLASFLITALCSLNKRCLAMENTAKVAKDRLSELTSREGDWFLDELCSMSGNVNQLLLLLKDYPMEVKEDQKSSQNRALNAMKAVMGVQKVFMALQELMTNFRMIIVPEAFKSIYAEDPSVFSVVQQLQAVASSQKMTLRKLVENLEARLLEGHEATEELDSKEVDAAVHEISVQFEKLLQTNKTSDSGEDSNNTMTSGQMLLAGFNGLFTKVASELSEMFTAFKQVHFGKHQLKFDFIRDAQELQLIDGTKNADLLGKLFYLKRLEVIISFFNSCRQSALSLKGVSSTGTKAGAVNCEAEPSNNLFVNVDSTSGETKIWNPDTCYSEDDLSVHVKHFIADCIQQCIMGLPSQALAAVIIPFASILGSKTEKESFDNNEKPVSLEEYCKKVVDSNLSCGLIKAKQLSHISGLASAYDVAWRKHDFARRLDNNMNIYKGVVQRAQLQLARFQWLYEDNLLQCPMRGNNMITPARATVMADLKKHVQGLIHMDSVVKGVEEKFGTQESSIEQRLKWAAGANPALNPVLQNFEQTLAARKKLLAVEGKHSSDICNLSNAILHCEALRTQTADAVGVDNVMTALVKRCQHSSAELESCSDKLQSVAEVAKKVKVSYPPEAPITLEWMKTKLDTVGQEIASVKTRKSQALQAISSVRDTIKSQASSVKTVMVAHQQLIGEVKAMLTTMAKDEEAAESRTAKLFISTHNRQSEECSHLIKTIVAVCSGKVNDSRDNMEANVKEVKTMVKSIKSLVHWVHDHLLSLASPLVPDESGSSGGKTPIAAPPPTFASALRQGSNASTQASKDSVAPDIASPVHPVILQRDTSASPTGAGSPTASGRVLAVASPKRLSTANLARDPRTGKALQERNMYAIGVWRRVKSKLDGRDQDNNKKMSVADQVDFVIRESRSLDNLSQMYEGWTAWV